MTFALTDELLDDIKNALENQENSFVVDAKNNMVIPVEKIPMANAGSEVKLSSCVDDNLFYALPEWTSAEGYEIRESFVNSLHSPLAKEELQQVLHSGRGVFKNFRNVLKKYPEVEKKWFVYKNRVLRNYINQWYNDLREIWGLEKLDYVPESDENLIHDDFSFLEYNPSTDNNEILQFIGASFFTDSDAEYSEKTDPEIINVLFSMWKEQFLGEQSLKIGYVCRSLSDDFAGCITAVPATENQEKVMKLTSLFVPEQFRGLGIGTELLSMCLSKLKECGKTWIILPDIIIPEILQPLLSRTGFEKIGTGYAVKLQ
ncbi:MAG: GNAT family N-acetyltransferase [Treponema sp.]|nr:GNAT family N-acetyltransferase [Treponema sp.]